MEYLDEISILSIVGLKLLTPEVLQAASANSKLFEPKLLRKLIRKVLGFEPQISFWLQRIFTEKKIIVNMPPLKSSPIKPSKSMLFFHI